jgi:tripartite-type tricarboxylate transporter receptor subunit TctC
MSVKSIIGLAALALGLGLAAPTLAQYPEKPINFVLPAGPGSATDTNTRLVLNKIQEMGTLGQPTVVINMDGGAIAATRVHAASPDGYEILVYHLGLMGQQAVGRLDFGVDAFVPIAQTGRTSFLIVTAEDGPYDDLQSLIDAAKAAPNTITEANSIGGAVHIATLQLAQAADYEARIVQVGDGPERLQSVIGRHTDYTVVSPQEYKGFSGTGIKALAVLGPDRHPDWPDVPSTGELGIETSVAVDVWWLAPVGTPEEVIDKLADAIEAAMADPELQQAYLAQGVVPMFNRGEELQKAIDALNAAIQPMGPALKGE